METPIFLFLEDHFKLLKMETPIRSKINPKIEIPMIFKNSMGRTPLLNSLSKGSAQIANNVVRMIKLTPTMTIYFNDFLSTRVFLL